MRKIPPSFTPEAPASTDAFVFASATAAASSAFFDASGSFTV